LMAYVCMEIIQQAIAEERGRVREEMVERVIEELPNLLHEYGKWLLENPDTEPLERKAKKQLIASSVLSEKSGEELLDK